MTNGDRIRQMSDEELAEYLILVSESATKFTLCDSECAKCSADQEACIAFCQMWVEQEAVCVNCAHRDAPLSFDCQSCASGDNYTEAEK